MVDDFFGALPADQQICREEGGRTCDSVTNRLGRVAQVARKSEMAALRAASSFRRQSVFVGEQELVLAARTQTQFLDKLCVFTDKNLCFVGIEMDYKISPILQPDSSNEEAVMSQGGS
jgi:hypothetical protein